MAALGSGIPDYQYAGDEDVLAARFASIERALATPPRRPAVGRWVMDEDAAGNPVLINIKTNMMYPITLGAGVALPPS